MIGVRIGAAVCLLAAAAGAQGTPPSARCVSAPDAPPYLATRDRAPLAGEIVIARAELERNGWSRLSEALQATTWSLASLEGYTFDASADGLPVERLSASGQPDWIVLVDGQRVPVRAAGTRLLELLPVSLAQVERIVVSRAPTFVAGRLAVRGVIDVRTRRAERAAVRGSYAIGNERGDPGPYRYTDLATPNVERLGPDAAVALFAGGRSADAQLAARYSSLNVTDEALLPRLDPAIGATGRGLFQLVKSVSARAGVDVACGRHDVVGGIARFSGILYQPARDDWTRTTLAHLGVAGDAPVGGALRLRYSLAGERFDLDTLSPRPSPALPHRRTALLAHADLSRTVGALELTVASAASAWTMDTETANARRRDISLAALLRHAGARVRTDLAVGGERSGDEHGLQLLAAVQARLDARTQLHASAGRAARPLDGEAWSEALLLPAELALAEAASAPSIDWAELAVHRAGDDWRMEFGADVRRAADWRVRTTDGIARGDVTVAGAHLRGETQLGTARAGLEYRLLVPSNPKPEVDPALGATARHAARATVTTERVAGNFRFSGAFTYRSATRWPPDLADSIAIARVLPALVRLDATVEKWLWRDRARVYLAARNLLDREERYHPAGAQFALRVHLGVDVELRRAP